MTAFALTWTRRDMRRGWLALTALALLVALATTTVFAALAGARRQASVGGRLAARTAPADVAIVANAPGYPWDRVRALPEIAQLANFGITVPIIGLPEAAQAEPILGRDMLRTVERPVVRAGRLFDFGRLDEGVVTPGFASAFGRGLGDTVDVVLPSPAELQAHEGSGPGGAFTGPRLHTHIVGIIVSSWYGDAPGTPGELLLPPAVAETYPLSVIGDASDPAKLAPANALAQLRGGPAGIVRLRSELAAFPGVSGVDVWDLRERFLQPFQRQATFTARCLVAFGLAALLAALVLIGSILTRYVSGRVDELLRLRASGLTSVGAAVAAALAPALAAACGVALGVLGAWLVSSWLPLGAARPTEPSPGRSLDWVVFGPGAAAIVVVTAAAALLAGLHAWRSAARATAGARRSAVATALVRCGAPVPAVVGSRFALEPGSGPRRVPVRAALVGVIAGVLGVVGALTFSHGVADASAHPERFGQTYDLSAFLGDNGYDVASSARVRAALDGQDAVTGVDDVRVSVATGARGIGSVTLLTYSWGRKPLPAVVSDGRLPAAPDEVLLTPTSLRDLHTGVGRSVTLTGTSGTSRYDVVGSGFLPVGFHNGYADGGWVTDGGYDAIFDSARFHTVYVAMRPGSRGPAGAARLTAAISRQRGLGQVAFAPREALPEVFQLHEVRQLPRLLGVFLALLAAGAVGYALVSAVRRRRGELAVLRSLGMTRRQTAVAVAAQANVLAVLGVVFGVPLGLAVARSMWEGVATSYPFQYHAPWTAVAWLVVPAALLLTNLLAAGPAWHAARLRVADVLRAE